MPISEMNKNPLVSVITTFLNAEKFIEESIQSVFAQTYRNWEYLLIDDGADDNSSNIAKNYAKRFPDKIYYFEHEGRKNKGISASRNLGVKYANGIYIATIDADDIWMPNKLEEQVSILESNPEAGMVFGNTIFWYSWSGNPKDEEKDYYLQDLIKPGAINLNSVINPPSLLSLILSYNIPTPSMSNLMMRKDFIQRIGGFEETFTGMHEDQAFLSKAYLNSPIYVTNECWDYYRMHENSCVSVAENEGRFLSTELFYLDWLKDYLSENDFNDPDVLFALKKRILKYKHPNLFELTNLYRKVKTKIKKVLGQT